MNLYLYNTLSRKKEQFRPLDPKHVRMYCCGPTVYDAAHIGNARPVVVVDVLYRLLQSLYPKVTYVRNITDIDDKIMNRARESSISIADLTRATTEKYHHDMGSLGALNPDIEPRATDHVQEMIDMIEELINRGHAYESEGHVLFAVKSLKSYGELSKLNQDDIIMGARVEVAPYKKDPADFVLWKPSNVSEGQPGWDSPWGVGRPGWHIECSAMSSKYLGNSFDIHAGGLDLIFPHHENEIAQSKGCHPEDSFARYWIHNGMLIVDGQKMSKSLGNFLTVTDLLDKIPGEVIRLVLLSTHYRQPLDWTDRAVEQSRSTLDRFYGALRGIEIDDLVEADPTIKEALIDDLNTPLAIARLHEIANAFYLAKDDPEKTRLASVLKKSADILGILAKDPEIWFKGELSDSLQIEDLIEQRNNARSTRDFAEADRIRDLLLDMGVVLEDGPNGTTWKRSA